MKERSRVELKMIVRVFHVLQQRVSSTWLRHALGLPKVIARPTLMATQMGSVAAVLVQIEEGARTPDEV